MRNPKVFKIIASLEVLFAVITLGVALVTSDPVWLFSTFLWVACAALSMMIGSMQEELKKYE